MKKTCDNCRILTPGLCVELSLVIDELMKNELSKWALVAPSQGVNMYVTHFESFLKYLLLFLFHEY